MSPGLKVSIKEEANRLGFELAGVTTPEPPPHYDVYERWLAAGRHGEMVYLEAVEARSRRSDPRQILPECRSILVLGMRYWAPHNHHSPVTEAGMRSPGDTQNLVISQPDKTARGQVAAYAWGEDYHEIFRVRLKRLIDFIQAEIGVEISSRWYSDTGAILERDLAQRAGLGWIGKNTCLINPQQGSYFLLAEVLLGLELEPDPPFIFDHCGSCTRCIEACPTGCILPDRTIDSQRCISYLTIELKGGIPPELRPLMGDWVFGCDVCQQVCPWNIRFAEHQGDPAFEPRPGVALPRLIEELNLGVESFSKKFKGSAVRRAKRRGYLRNVAVALGNRPDPEAVPYLERVMLEDEDALVRLHAAWALGRLGKNRAREMLEKALQNEEDGSVLEEIRRTLMDV